MKAVIKNALSFYNTMLNTSIKTRDGVTVLADAESIITIHDDRIKAGLYRINDILSMGHLLPDYMRQSDDAELCAYSTEYPNLTEHFSAGSDIVKAIETCSHAMAKNDVRFYINGMTFFPKEGHIVSTDGHRLALDVCEFSGPETEDPPTDFIVPNGVVKALKGCDIKEVAFCSVENNVFKKYAKFIANKKGVDFTLLTRCIDGKFVPYEMVMPKKAEYSGFILSYSDIQCWMNALKEFIQYHKINKTGYPHCTIELHDGFVYLFVKGVSIPPVKTLADGLSIDGFTTRFININPSYLMDTLKAVQKGNSVALQFSRGYMDTSSLLIESKNYKSIIMPVRV